jgi:hypothetical protein
VLWPNPPVVPAIPSGVGLTFDVWLVVLWVELPR